MAPPKKKGAVCKSAKYYRDNPTARKKKAATDKKVNARSEQKSKRRELGRKNYAADKKGVNRSGKDLSHTSNGTIYKDSSKNRGSSKDTQGDKRARGKKK